MLMKQVNEDLILEVKFKLDAALVPSSVKNGYWTWMKLKEF